MGKFSDKLVKGSLYTFGSLVGINILTLIYSVVLARMLVILEGETLGIEYLGIFGLLRELGLIIIPLLVLAIPTAMAKFIPEYQTRKKSMVTPLINTGLYIACFSAVIGAIVYFLLSDIIAVHIFDTPLLGLLMKINAFYVIFTVLISTVIGIQQGFQEIKLIAKLNLLNSLISVPILIIFVINYSLIGVVVAGVINVVIFLCIAIYYLVRTLETRKLSIEFKLDKVVTRDLFKFTAPIIMSIIILRPAHLFGRAYLAVADGWVDVGFYKIGFTFYGLLLFIPAAISIPLIPMISELDARRPDLRAGIVSRIVKLGMFIILPLTIVIALFSEQFIWLLFGDAYLPAAEIVMLMAVSSFLMAFYSIVGSIMVGTGKTLQLLYIDIVHAVLFVALAYYLINVYGLSGLGVTWVLIPIILIAPYIVYLYKNDIIQLRPIGEAWAVAAVFLPLTLYTYMYWQDYIYIMLPAILTSVILIEIALLTSKDKKLISEWTDKIKGKLT